MRVKVCGLTRPEDVETAASAGALCLGFVFFPPSPRSLTVERARPLMRGAPKGIAKVALTVDADDALIDSLSSLPVDILQLHGDESPGRVADLRRGTGLPVIKAIGVRGAADLDRVALYAPVADQLLIDAKPPEGASRPGGNARAFDWTLLSGRHWPLPWFLAGGLAPENVREAVRITGATQVDVSSGVESALGVKSPRKIRAFVEAARCASIESPSSPIEFSTQVRDLDKKHRGTEETL